MERIFLNNGISLNEQKSLKFKTFCNFLLEENSKYNLTAIRSEEGVYLKHFADSLTGALYFNGANRVLEIGSGAGFPSIPLKINQSELNFTLIESTGKKCAFLKKAGELLGFKDFNVLCGRAEDFARKPEYIEKFEVVTARAVAELNVLLELCAAFLKIGGKAVFYKNYSESEIKNAEKALKTLGLKIESVNKYVLNGDENNLERAIIVIKKKDKTPEKYPREYKKIISKPL